MPTQVDLGNQVQGILPLRFGGTGNEYGRSNEQVMLAFSNDTGADLVIGTLVKRTAGINLASADTRVTSTTAASDIAIGVVVGRYVDGGETFEAEDAPHDGIVAVCVSGRCQVQTAGAVTQGEYALASGTAGAATSTATTAVGVFGIFERTTAGAAMADVILTGSASVYPVVFYTINFLISAGGSATPAIGIQGSVSIDAPGTIVSARMLALSSGSAVVDVLKSTYSGYPTTSSICASAKPTLSSSTKSEDTTLTGWTTSLAMGDVLQFELESISGIFVVTCALKVRRS